MELANYFAAGLEHAVSTLDNPSVAAVLPTSSSSATALLATKASTASTAAKSIENIETPSVNDHGSSDALLASAMGSSGAIRSSVNPFRKPDQVLIH